MAKIGRNSPCPCGSNKKYKKCCFRKDADGTKTSLPSLQTEHTVLPVEKKWHDGQIHSLTIAAIFSQLERYGIVLDRKQSQEKINEHKTADSFLSACYQDNEITGHEQEEFIWKSMVVLWCRLAQSLEKETHLNALMQQGHTLVSARKSVDGCEKWLTLWKMLKPRFTRQMKSIYTADIIFDGLELISNWTQDLEIELNNAGIDDKSYYVKRIDYCREVCELFPESDELYYVNMRKAIAESYFYLDKKEEGEKEFLSLSESKPNNAWVYIAWADMYGAFALNDEHINANKARNLYQKAAEIDSNLNDIILDRISSIEKK